MIKQTVKPVRERKVKLYLVPVEVFGVDGDYGLMDCVSSWSDCNRAAGKIYRVDEADGQKYRKPGETVAIWVDEKDLPFFKKIWGDNL